MDISRLVLMLIQFEKDAHVNSTLSQKTLIWIPMVMMRLIQLLEKVRLYTVDYQNKTHPNYGHFSKRALFW